GRGTTYFCFVRIESWTKAPLTHGLGWSKQEVEVFVVELREQFNDQRIHAYWPCYALYGKILDPRDRSCVRTLREVSMKRTGPGHLLLELLQYTWHVILS
ncbi:hypothetical protein JMJ77_0010585, partial [Colletotrichum scovillei]